MDHVQEKIGLLAEALQSLRLAPAWDEYEIHNAVKDCLEKHGIRYAHEAKLLPGCRADFLIEDCIVLEVKRGRPAPSVVRRQVGRYLACEAVQAAIVLSEKRVSLPQKIQGKPCWALSLSEFWGVAL